MYSLVIILRLIISLTELPDMADLHEAPLCAGFMGETGNEGEQGPEGNPSLWSNAKSACARSATATMKLTDCDSHACRLETLYNGVWGSVCGEDWGPHSTRTMCKALGLPGSGRVKFNFVSGAMGTGSKGHVWLSKVQCKGSEGDVADCKHSGFGKHTCGHYNEVRAWCACVAVMVVAVVVVFIGTQM
jgi:hypothetical protein